MYKVSRGSDELNEAHLKNGFVDFFISFLFHPLLYRLRVAHEFVDLGFEPCRSLGAPHQPDFEDVDVSARLDRLVEAVVLGRLVVPPVGVQCRPVSRNGTHRVAQLEYTLCNNVMVTSSHTSRDS